MAKTRLSSTTVLIIAAAVAVVAYILWRRFFSKSAQYDDDAAVESPRRPALASVPNGTPIRLADAMRLSVDDKFPRIESASVKVLHGDGEARALIEDVAARMNKNGARVTPLATESARIAKFVDGKGVVRVDLDFLVHDATASKPGYQAYQVSKLRATYLQAPPAAPVLYSLVFATPHAPVEGAPTGFDADDAPLARFESPLEVLQQMQFTHAQT